MLTTESLWQYDTVARFSLNRVTVERNYFGKFDSSQDYFDIFLSEPHKPD